MSGAILHCLGWGHLGPSGAASGCLVLSGACVGPPTAIYSCLALTGACLNPSGAIWTHSVTCYIGMKFEQGLLYQVGNPLLVVRPFGIYLSVTMQRDAIHALCSKPCLFRLQRVIASLSLTNLGFITEQNVVYHCPNGPIF